MARIPNGILGEFLGKAGNVSGYMRNGTNFLRSRRSASNKPTTPNRLAQQQKIKVCNEFTKTFTGKGFFNTTFPSYGSTASGYNRATSALMNKAVAGIYPAIYISYPQVLVSQGQLPSATGAAAAKNVEGNIVFRWADNTGFGSARATDKAILVAYFPSLLQAVYVISSSTRKDESAILDTHLYTGCIVETWIGFVSNDEADAADSVYTGNLKL